MYGLKKVGNGMEVFISIMSGNCVDDDISNFIEKYGKLDNITLNHTQLSNSVKDCNLKSIQSMKKYTKNA